MLTVLDPGLRTLLQDLGRPGRAAIGVSRSGAADRAALRLANRLVGNPESAAGLEVLLGGLALTTDTTVLLAVTGAPVPVTAPTGAAVGGAFALRPGQRLALDRPTAGMRSYVAVRGGLAVPAVLGSRSTDTLSGLGPAPCVAGTRLPVGPAPAGPVPAVDVAPVAAPPAGPVTLGAIPGPRDAEFTAGSLDRLTDTPWQADAASDRVGIRLRGGRLAPRHDAASASEGMVAGGIQVPPRGEPIVFGPDHPTTGGYPVIAVVRDADLDRLGQIRPGQPVRFRLLPRPL